MKIVRGVAVLAICLLVISAVSRSMLRAASNSFAVCKINTCIVVCGGYCNVPVTNPSLLDIGPKTPVAGNITPAGNKNAIIQFSLTDQSGNGDLLRTLSFTETGVPALQTADVGTYYLFEDPNNTGSPTGTGVVQKSTATFASKTFSSISSSIGKNATMYYVMAVDVANTATNGDICKIHIAASGVSTSNGVKEKSGKGYIDGNAMTVVNTSKLTLTGGSNLPAGNVFIGAPNQPLMQFTLTQDNTGGAPGVTGVTVHPAAGNTATFATDLSTVSIYKEVSVDGSPIGDTWLAQGTLIGGNFVFTISENIPTGPGTTFLVVADINPSATNGHVVQLLIAQTDIVTTTQWVGGVVSFTEDKRTITLPAATHLSVTIQPQSSTVGPAIPMVEVKALKSDNSVDAAYASIVSVSLAGPGSFDGTSTLSVLASSGVASFSNLILHTSGVYTLTFSSLPLTGTTSNQFTMTAAAPTQIVVTSEPVDGVAGIALNGNVGPGSFPGVKALDQFGNLATSFTGTVTAQLSPAAAPLSGTLAVAAVNGMAQFSNLVIMKAGLGYHMVFTTPPGTTGWNPSCVSTFAVAVGQAVGITVTMQPGNTGSMAVIDNNNHPAIAVVDIGGNVCTTYAVAVDVSIKSGTGDPSAILSGTTSIVPNQGVLTFSDLSIDKAGNNYKLHFTSGTGPTTLLPTDSTAFAILVGLPYKLTVVQQPTDSTGGITLPQQPVVQVQDSGGNLVSTVNTGTVTAAITANSGDIAGVLTPVANKVMNVSGGIATFAGLTIDKASANPYSLTFTSNAGLQTTMSANFVISVGAAIKLGLSVQPGMASMGADFVQQPVLQVQDAGGNLITTGSAATAHVMVVIKSGTGVAGSTLSGTTSMNCTGGAAAFTNLGIDFPGPQFVLSFSSTAVPSLSAVDSAPFNVASTADRLGVLTEPAIGVVGSVLTIQPVVEVRDPIGTLVSVDNFTMVTAEIASGTGSPAGVLVGTATVQAVNGTATFTNLQISAPGVGYHLKFTCSPALTPVYSAGFDIAGPAVRLAMVAQPICGHAAEPLTTQPVLQVLDSNSVRVVNDNTTLVTAMISPATGTAFASTIGGSTVTSSNGIVTFTTLGVDRGGNGYRLSFIATPSLAPAQSSSFDVLGPLAPPTNGKKPIVGGNPANTCSQSTGDLPWMLMLMVLGALGASAVLRRSRA